MQLYIFFDFHNPFECPETALINIATGVVASDDINEETAFEIVARNLSELDDTKLGEVALKRKDQGKSFTTVRKSVKFDCK